MKETSIDEVIDTAAKAGPALSTRLWERIILNLEIQPKDGHKTVPPKSPCPGC